MADQNYEEENLRKSIYSIDVSKGPRSLPMRKGTACAVKREGSSSAILLTSQKVVEQGGTFTQGNLSLSSKQFCSKYPDHEAEDRHRIKYALQPRNKEQFCFISLQTSPKNALKLVSADKLRGEAGQGLLKSKCLSYTFFGNSFKTLTWEYNEEEGTHELTDVDPKGDLGSSACRGSPVVSTQDDDRSVIGVVDCTSDGDLFLMFFKESSLEIEELRAGCSDEDGRDVTDSPFIPRESTPSAPPPEEQPLDAERNNSSQEPGATLDNARMDDEDSAAKRPPEENDTLRESGGVTTPSSATTLTETLSGISIHAQETNPCGEKKLSKERKSEERKSEESKICLWNQELQSLEYFQHLLTSILKINLDPKRELGGDYRSLAGVMGKNMKYIWYLATTQSPVEELLRNHDPLTLYLLNNLLSSKEVDRKDVAKEITDWVEKQGCNCSECGGIR